MKKQGGGLTGLLGPVPGRKNKPGESLVSTKHEQEPTAPPLFIIPPTIGANKSTFFEVVLKWFRQRHQINANVVNESQTKSIEGTPSPSPSLYIPWRHQPYSRDPYSIWVSEVMSQQTQMATVVRYWSAWMKAFPTVESLAAADPAAVRAVWAGMGYYRRADLLHKGAQYIVNEYRTITKGQRSEATTETSDENPEQPTSIFPTTYEEWVKVVPGVGPYTAAAITSICFGVPATAVDGNVMRVMSRLCGTRNVDPKNPKHISLLQQTLNVGLTSGRRQGDVSSNAEASGSRGKGTKRSRSAADEKGDVAVPDPTTTALPFLSDCVPSERGKVNEGLMEIGASICRPVVAPLCGECPLSKFCSARRMLELGDIESIEGCIPLRGSGTATRDEHVRTLILFVRNDVNKGRKKLSATTGVISAADGVSSLLDQFTSQYSIFCVKRPKGGLLSEMTDFPYESIEAEATKKLTKKQKEKSSLVPNAASVILVGQFVHVFSHIRMKVDVHAAIFDTAAEAVAELKKMNLGVGLDPFLLPLSSLSTLPVSQLALKSLCEALPTALRDSGSKVTLSTKEIKELALSLCNRTR